MTTKAKGKAMMTEDEIILDLARRVDAMEPYTRALVMQRMDQRLRTIPCRRKSLPGGCVVVSPLHWHKKR